MTNVSQRHESDQHTDAGTRFDAAAERILTGQLPLPLHIRWQPLRAGLMNVFLFEDERFPFADGRLLLRGSNGTGKSRVLAMTLPLLLDGSFKATRVEPDRDSNRQVAWNLLMDDQPSATGYSWLEFGRVERHEDPDPSANGTGGAEGDRFLTIGCGMRAKRGQRIKPWFFITELRVDEALNLKSADGVPLTQRQLAEALGERGRVYETATEYRRAVDERLFRLGERYDALIELLLQLRQPKLAEKLDIVGLEASLREALPPLPESLLDDAAEAFLELDQYRSLLAADRQTLRDIQRFLRPYRDHVQRGVKRALKELTKANSQYERAQRDLKKLGEELEDQQTKLSNLKSQRSVLEIKIKSGRAAISQLQHSPEMKNAQLLTGLNEQAEKLTDRESKASKSVDSLQQQQQAAEGRATKSKAEAGKKLRTVREESKSCRSVAAPESLQNRHAEKITTCLSVEGLGTFPDAKSNVQRHASRMLKSAEHLIGLNAVLSGHRRQRQTLRREAERCEQSQQAKQDSLTAAQQARDTTRTELWDAILKWFGSAKRLRSFLEPTESWADRWNAWPGDLHETNPSLSIVQSAQSRAIKKLLTEQERTRQAVEQLDRQTKLLEDEQTRLEAGATILPPERSHRRDSDGSKTIDDPEGAPFWRLFEFQPAVPKAERGNWEAALHDAGLLDAIVTPHGELVSVGNGDTANIRIATGEMSDQPKDRQLARVLLVTDNSALTDSVREAAEAILKVVGVGADAGRTWIANDGTWRNGPLNGRFTKPEPQYIGRKTRDRWRRMRLDEIGNELKEATEQRGQLTQQIDDLASRQTEVDTEAASFPSSQMLLDANAALGRAHSDVDAAAEGVRVAQAAEVTHQNVLDKATHKRDEFAADTGLSAWADRAEELKSRIEKYIAGLKLLAARIDAFQTTLSQARQDQRAVRDASQRFDDATSGLKDIRVELGEVREKVRVLEESAGQSVSEILERLRHEREQQDEREQQAEDSRTEETAVISQIAVTENQLEQSEESSSLHDAKRRDATQSFATLHELDLITFVAQDTEVPELPWSMSAAIRLARQMDTVLAKVPADNESWLSSQDRLQRAQTELQQTVLSQDSMDVEVEPLADGLRRVLLSVQGERSAPMQAVRRLETDIETRERILDAKEQDTLEKYLLGEVAEGLRKGMAMASELVEVMTSEVSKRPMKTGMQMRFKWQQDDEGPTGLAEACEVLASDSSTWSPDEREQIKLFLQRSIREQRESDLTASWHEHMTKALDYRRWYRIVIERRSGPDANWLKLTRRTYAGGSGGEKAIALTLPPLAAAAAYYKSADPLAPRFILLDEAFAGISSDMRESCMELISAFELDIVMTSESEWGMYRGVRQLAICQLDRFSDINAVVNRVFVWNGSQRCEKKAVEEAVDSPGQLPFAETADE
jgi:uncharacterized protein (TIGR02680 family)